jgi:hypothetical protein
LEIQSRLEVRDVPPAQMADGKVKNLEIIGPLKLDSKIE